METNLPTPMSARVYVNLPEANYCSCGILWHLGKLKAFFLSFPVTVVANMRSCNVDSRSVISPNCSLLAVGQSGRSGPRHQKSWGEHSLLRFAPQGERLSQWSHGQPNSCQMCCALDKNKNWNLMLTGMFQWYWGLRAIALLAVLQPLPVEKGFSTKWAVYYDYCTVWTHAHMYIYIYEVPELFAARRLFGWFIFGSH